MSSGWTERAFYRTPDGRTNREGLARLPSWLVALDAEVLRQSDRAGCLEPVVSMAVLLVSASTVVRQCLTISVAPLHGSSYGNVRVTFGWDDDGAADVEVED